MSNRNHSISSAPRYDNPHMPHGLHGDSPSLCGARACGTHGSRRSHPVAAIDHPGNQHPPRRHTLLVAHPAAGCHAGKPGSSADPNDAHATVGALPKVIFSNAQRCAFVRDDYPMLRALEKVKAARWPACGFFVHRWRSLLRGVKLDFEMRRLGPGAAGWSPSTTPVPMCPASASVGKFLRELKKSHRTRG